MDIIELINNIKNKFSNYTFIKIKEKLIPFHVNLEEIHEVEEALKFVLPNNIKDLYLNYANGLYFSWYNENTSFGPMCKRGEINLISIKGILEKYSEMQELVKEADKNQFELESNEGLKALVNDWPYWIPIFLFASGDAFCIDIRDNSIRFLEHDVMDGGPNVHGLLIASSFDELLSNWYKINFVDLYDWSKVINNNGINLGSEIFNNLI